MIAAVLLFIVSLASGLFLGSRLYLLAARGQLNVKGAVYSRTSTPVLYWVTFACALAGTILMIGIAVAMAMGLTNVWGPPSAETFAAIDRSGPDLPSPPSARYP